MYHYGKDFNKEEDIDDLLWEFISTNKYQQPPKQNSAPVDKKDDFSDNSPSFSNF